jgi:hypothetical protein
MISPAMRRVTYLDSESGNVSIGGGKASEVRDRLDIPNNDVFQHRARPNATLIGTTQKLVGCHQLADQLVCGFEEQITRDPCRIISAGRNRETDTSKAARATRMLPARAKTS